jgi:DNA (cytosine-5)-methyltransferase 1
VQAGGDAAVTRPRLLDLFCGAGGASMGYHRAGFDVTGVDVAPQPRYPFEFVQADAMTFPLEGYDAYGGSPPCDDHSTLAFVNAAKGTGWMLAATLERFAALEAPWVVENVEMADMPGSVMLCGSEFGLRSRMDDGREVWLKRHRRFRSNVFLWGAGGCNCHGKPVIGVYGGGAGGPRQGAGRGKGAARAAREVMQIDWMNRDELDRAIPPAFTEFVGLQLLEHIAAERAA